MASDSTAPEEMMSEASMSDGPVSDEMASAAPATEEAMSSEDAAGAYITLAEYDGGKDMYDNGQVVLFFHAPWCPTCKTTQENLEADPAAIPAGLTIVKVDYDTSDELKQRYGIATQHTFVQVDADGNELAKWTGSSTADEIAGQLA